MNIKELGSALRSLTKGEQLIGSPIFSDETIIYSRNIAIAKKRWNMVVNFIESHLGRITYENEVVSFTDNFITANISPLIKINDVYLFRVLLLNSPYGSSMQEAIAISETPTAEMVEHFYKRTKEHITRVKDNLKIINDWFDFDKKEIEERANSHDLSKYSDIEKEPYIWLSWYYKEKEAGREFTYPPNVKDEITKATKHHISVNPHHPESHNSPKDMTNVDIAEMIADHAAMSQELGSSLFDWTKNNTIKNYDWKPIQIRLIWSIVKIFSH